MNTHILSKGIIELQDEKLRLIRNLETYKRQHKILVGSVKYEIGVEIAQDNIKKCNTAIEILELLGGKRDINREIQT